MRRHPSYTGYSIPEPRSHVQIVTVAPVVQLDDLRAARDRRRRAVARKASAARRGHNAS